MSASRPDNTERNAHIIDLDLQGKAPAGAAHMAEVKCPACGCDALVYGVPIAAPLKTIDDDEITERQQYLPARFECIACGLKMSSYAQLGACNLGDAFTSTSTYSAADYYIDQYRGYDDDNNENI